MLVAGIERLRLAAHHRQQADDLFLNLDRNDQRRLAKPGDLKPLHRLAVDG